MEKINEIENCCDEMVIKKENGQWVFQIEQLQHWDDGEYSDYDIYYEEYKINYCPFCGKKLE